MPIPLGPQESEAFLQTHDAPTPQLDLVAAAAFRAVGTAVRLGLFAELGTRSLTGSELADRLSADPSAVDLLARVLAAAGYLDTADGTYANSRATRRWLLPDAPGNMIAAVMLWQDLLGELWADLDATVRTGRPAGTFYDWLERHPDKAAGFQQMNAGLAAWVAPDVVEAAGLPATGRLLDVGGGHAVFSIACCRARPDLHATVLDLPEALKAGGRAVEESGLDDRITLLAGDMLSGASLLGPEATDGYDVILLCNLLHGCSPEQVADLVRRCAAGCRPGGTLVVLDQLVAAEPDTGDPDGAFDRAFLAAFSLNLFHTQGGRLYRRDELDAVITGAGFAAPTWTTLSKIPTHQVAVARKEDRS